MVSNVQLLIATISRESKHRHQWALELYVMKLELCSWRLLSCQVALRYNI